MATADRDAEDVLIRAGREHVAGAAQQVGRLKGGWRRIIVFCPTSN
jgi:hypothetical protein